MCIYIYTCIHNNSMNHTMNKHICFAGLLYTRGISATMYTRKPFTMRFQRYLLRRVSMHVPSVHACCSHMYKYSPLWQTQVHPTAPAFMYLHIPTH